jgi:hypothetical protein
MRWLVAFSIVLLAAALAYALWPVAPAGLPAGADARLPGPPPAEPTRGAAPTPPRAPRTTAPSPPAPVAPTPPPAALPAPAPVAAAPLDPATLIPEPAANEPPDAGVIHALTRDGIRGAIQEKLPEIKECYEAWLAQNPKLGGKLKVDFRIQEVPGFERGRVSEITVLDGGFGHVAMEGCVRNVFEELRFERPPQGELRVTYPLAFSPGPDAGP